MRSNNIRKSNKIIKEEKEKKGQLPTKKQEQKVKTIESNNVED